VSATTWVRMPRCRWSFSGWTACLLRLSGACRACRIGISQRPMNSLLARWGEFSLSCGRLREESRRWIWRRSSNKYAQTMVAIVEASINAVWFLKARYPGDTLMRTALAGGVPGAYHGDFQGV
jgi:hypothetical protein